MAKKRKKRPDEVILSCICDFHRRQLWVIKNNYTMLRSPKHEGGLIALCDALLKIGVPKCRKERTVKRLQRLAAKERQQLSREPTLLLSIIRELQKQ